MKLGSRLRGNDDRRRNPHIHKRSPTPSPSKSMTSSATARYGRAMPFSLVDFLQALAAGILVGATYALMCVGLGIIFGAMRVINFAQGDFLMLGMYAAFYLATAGGLSAVLGPSGGPIVAAFLAGPIVFALGWLIHRFIVARVTGAGAAQTEGAGAYGQILTTLGISLILQNGGLIVFGSAPTGIRTPLSRSSWEIGDILLNRGRCVSFLVSVGLAVAVYLFLGHTRQARHCVLRPTTARRHFTWASMSTRRTGSPGASGSASPRSPAGSSRAPNRSSPTPGSISSSSCMRGWCWAVSAA